MFEIVGELLGGYSPIASCFSDKSWLLEAKASFTRASIFARFTLVRSTATFESSVPNFDLIVPLPTFRLAL